VKYKHNSKLTSQPPHCLCLCTTKVRTADLTSLVKGRGTAEAVEGFCSHALTHPLHLRMIRTAIRPRKAPKEYYEIQA